MINWQLSIISKYKDLGKKIEGSLLASSMDGCSLIIVHRSFFD
jgi:hypothetical protein